jgi:nucleoside-diphosphate-sugar epimerase
MRRLVVWGAGELGGRVVRLWCDAGGRAVAYTRTETRHAALRDAGAEPRTGSPVDALRTDDALLLALPGTAALAGAVAALARAERPARSVLISSTGFHAGTRGAVDERSEPGPGPRPRSIAACERAFFAWSHDTGVVLRCGGLYRAGRGPLAVLRRSGAAPVGPPDTTLALVHYDDAANAALGALTHPKPAALYVCVTPPCPSRREFWEEACRTQGAPPPEFGPPTEQAPLVYDVSLLRRDLLPEPAHPDWRAAARA